MKNGNENYLEIYKELEKSNVLAEKAIEEEDILSRKNGPLDKVWGMVQDLFFIVTSSSKEIPTKVKVSASAALAYVVLPIDAIPDWIPLAGLVDDAAVVGFVVSQLGTFFDSLDWQSIKEGAQNVLNKSVDTSKNLYSNLVTSKVFEAFVNMLESILEKNEKKIKRNIRKFTNRVRKEESSIFDAMVGGDYEDIMSSINSDDLFEGLNQIDDGVSKATDKLKALAVKWGKIAFEEGVRLAIDIAKDAAVKKLTSS